MREAQDKIPKYNGI